MIVLWLGQFQKKTKIVNDNRAKESNERLLMNELLPLTQLLYSCWIVGGADDEETPAVPSGGGVFEHALRDAVKQEAFPEWARKKLHFVSGDVGLTCLELPTVQKLATEIKLTSDPNPSYTRTNIIVGKPVALRCLAKLRVPENLARKWGKVLRQAAERAEKDLAFATSPAVAE